MMPASLGATMTVEDSVCARIETSVPVTLTYFTAVAEIGRLHSIGAQARKPPMPVLTYYTLVDGEISALTTN